MDISIFDVVGPVMVGPSSSHTAGAARLSRIASLVAAQPFFHVSFGLTGSFAKTYKGHGTDRALVAGALGLREDDDRLADAFAIAAQRGLTYDFYELELDGMHENTVKMTFSLSAGGESEVIGSSIGGGQVVIRSIGGFGVEFDARTTTLIIRQMDKKGVVSEVTGLLAESGINIAVMRVSRRARGDVACCIIETDSPVPDSVVGAIRARENILGAQVIHIAEGEIG